MDDSEPQDLCQNSVRRPSVLLLSADDEVGALAPELDSNVESEVIASISELASRASREGVGSPDVVFLDLDLCGSSEDEIVRLVRANFPNVPIVALASDVDCERTARLLTAGVPSLNKPVSAQALTALVARLSRDPAAIQADPGSSRPGAGRLEGLLEAYSSERGLSPQQRLILRLHLAGNNDKEIASTCSCSEATVYEHWRRMARKAGGLHKGCVINDFHKFLDR